MMTMLLIEILVTRAFVLFILKTLLDGRVIVTIQRQNLLW